MIVSFFLCFSLLSVAISPVCDKRHARTNLYIVLDPCVQLRTSVVKLDSLVGTGTCHQFAWCRRSRIRSINVDLLTGMGNGDSRLNIVITKYLQSTHKVL